MSALIAVIELDSKDIGARMQLACFYIWLGDMLHARDQYCAVLRMHPNDRAAADGLARTPCRRVIE